MILQPGMYVNAYDAFKVMVYVHNAHQVSYHLYVGPSVWWQISDE